MVLAPIIARFSIKFNNKSETEIKIIQKHIKIIQPRFAFLCYNKSVITILSTK